jgi:hypothetical protein
MVAATLVEVTVEVVTLVEAISCLYETDWAAFCLKGIHDSDYLQLKFHNTRVIWLAIIQAMPSTRSEPDQPMTSLCGLLTKLNTNYATPDISKHQLFMLRATSHLSKIMSTERQKRNIVIIGRSPMSISVPQNTSSRAYTLQAAA